MNPDERRANFAQAFYRQALSDWEVYRLLAATENLPACHRLHYLQMACEKIAKAYRLRDTAAEVDDLVSKHTGFTKFINSFLRSPKLVEEYAGRTSGYRNLCRAATKFAKEIEKLAPSTDRAASPENAEYPWQRGNTVMVPCEFTYPTLSLLSESGGRAFLKLIGRTMSDYGKIVIR